MATNSVSKTPKTTDLQRYQMLLNIAEVQANADLVDLCNRKIASLKKRSENKTETEQQKQNKTIGQMVVDMMEPNMLYSIGDIIKQIDFSEIVTEPMSSQRMSPILNRLVTEGIIIKERDKRDKPFFKLA